MSLLIAILIILVVLALLLYAIDLLPFGDATIKLLLKAVAVIIAALLICQKAGLI